MNLGGFSFKSFVLQYLEFDSWVCCFALGLVLNCACFWMCLAINVSATRSCRVALWSLLLLTWALVQAGWLECVVLDRTVVSCQSPGWNGLYAEYCLLVVHISQLFVAESKQQKQLHKCIHSGCCETLCLKICLNKWTKFNRLQTSW
jgi:hypothetical protein